MEGCSDSVVLALSFASGCQALCRALRSFAIIFTAAVICTGKAHTRCLNYTGELFQRGLYMCLSLTQINLTMRLPTTYVPDDSRVSTARSSSSHTNLHHMEKPSTTGRSGIRGLGGDKHCPYIPYSLVKEYLNKSAELRSFWMRSSGIGTSFNLMLVLCDKTICDTLQSSSAQEHERRRFMYFVGSISAETWKYFAPPHANVSVDVAVDLTRPRE